MSTKYTIGKMLLAGGAVAFLGKAVGLLDAAEALTNYTVNAEAIVVASNTATSDTTSMVFSVSGRTLTPEPLKPEHPPDQIRAQMALLAHGIPTGPQMLRPSDRPGFSPNSKSS
jgi:hypothetical protein